MLNVKYTDDSFILPVSFAFWQPLFSKVKLYLMIVDPAKKSRFVFKARLPRRTNSFCLYETQNQLPDIPAQYEGGYFNGNIIIKKNDLPKDAKFYFQMVESFGSFFETDYYTVDQKEVKLPTKGIWALIPCYNVQNYCKKVVERTLPFVEKIILIDDGSKDGTKKVLKEIKEQYPEQILFLDNEHNRGKGFCLLDGFKAFSKSSGEVVVALDSDSQHDPEDIPRLAGAILDGEDLAVGTRTFKNMPFKSRYANTLICLILRIRFPHAPKDTQSGYRAFSKKLSQELAAKMRGGRYEMEFECLLYALEKRKRVRSLPICTIYINDNKSSHFSAFKDSLKILKIFFQHRKAKYP